TSYGRAFFTSGASTFSFITPRVHNEPMKLRGVRTGVISSLIAAIITPIPAQAAEPTFTVMSRNIYLGADVGVALDLIPDMPAAAQFMWDQVKKNDFSKRSIALAAEIQTYKPDVIGLQEATIWYCKKNAWSKKVAVFNFTDQLLEALGGDYVLASKDGKTAFNPGYSINPIPFLTMVKDPTRFQKLFGRCPGNQKRAFSTSYKCGKYRVRS
ncbi:MAG: hypothetical protein RJA40_1051, partial [Actinomycetota bacterium]